MQCATTAHQYLSKPCDSAKLEACIERVVSLQGHVHSEAVCKLVGTISNLPSCPELFNKINRTLNAEPGDLAIISALVEQDAAMTAKLLKLVNSAFFGVGYEVASAMEAVNYLGTDALKTIVLATQVFDHSKHLALAGLDMQRLWQSALLTGQCAKALALAHAPTRELRDEAFTAGVLLSCGLLVLAESQPAQLKQAIAAARCAHEPLPSHELQLLGATDAEIGGYLLGLWCLPMPIVDAVMHYQAGPPPQASVAPLSLLVHAAHALLGEHQPLIEGVPADPLNVALLEAHGWGLLIPLWRECVANTVGPKG
jgi:HD-like signal output (HDOD) protein